MVQELVSNYANQEETDTSSSISAIWRRIEHPDEAEKKHHSKRDYAWSAWESKPPMSGGLRPEEYLGRLVAHYEKRIRELERQVAILKSDQVGDDDLWKQNEASIRALETIFNIDANDNVDTKKLDGLLSDCVDENQNSMELVRAIRGG